jgi:hypothetical protein
MPEWVHNEFVLYSESKSICAYLDTTEDMVFLETAYRIRQFNEKSKLKLSDFEVNEIIESAFSITCDIAPDGSVYRIGLLPKCPNCGEREGISWSISPSSFVYLPIVSHELWEGLRQNEKHEKMRIHFEIQYTLKTK